MHKISIFLLFISISTVGFSSETVLLIMRHGQTDWNIDDRLQGHTDNPLNATGIAQAEALAEKIESRYPYLTAIYSSDLSSALATAQKTAEKLYLQVNVREALRERNYGDAEGISFQEEDALYGASEATLDQLYPYYRDRWCHTPIPGAETYNELLQRVKAELLRIVDRHPGETVGVFAHGGVIAMLIADLLNQEEPPMTPNCSMTQIVYSSDNPDHPFKFISTEE
jgi:2,3-bisphosphoglycerate-dependent phosphoglycerate mutase